MWKLKNSFQFKKCMLHEYLGSFRAWKTEQLKMMLLQLILSNIDQNANGEKSLWFFLDIEIILLHKWMWISYIKIWTDIFLIRQRFWWYTR